MTDESETAELITDGATQTVRLPKDFHLPGREARVRHFGRGLLLEPLGRDGRDIAAIFSEIDRLGGADFLSDGRPTQPSMPQSEDFSFPG